MALFGLGGAVLFGSANLMLGLKGVDASKFKEEQQQGFRTKTPTTGPGTPAGTTPGTFEQKPFKETPAGTTPGAFEDETTFGQGKFGMGGKFEKPSEPFQEFARGTSTKQGPAGEFEKGKFERPPKPAGEFKAKPGPTPEPSGEFKAKPEPSGEFKAKPAHEDPHHQQAPPGRQQIPNPLGYSSQGNFIGGVETHEHGTIPQPVFQTPSVPKQQLVAAATFNEFFGGDNEALIKLANASYVAEINKYNVVFG
jgi:hypothetical protein